MEKQVVLRLGCRAGHILLSKEKEPSDLYQHWLLSLLSLEGKIFFSIVAQHFASYLERNSLMHTIEQTAEIQLYIITKGFTTVLLQGVQLPYLLSQWRWG